MAGIIHFLMVPMCKKRCKQVQKNVEDVGMAVPKTTESRCRVGSVQARYVNNTKTQKLPFPVIS